VHGCLSVVSVVCCQVGVSATGWSLVQRSPTVVVCDLETAWVRRPWLTGGCCAKRKKNQLITFFHRSFVAGGSVTGDLRWDSFSHKRNVKMGTVGTDKLFWQEKGCTCAAASRPRQTTTVLCTQRSTNLQLCWNQSFWSKSTYTMLQKTPQCCRIP